MTEVDVKTQVTSLVARLSEAPAETSPAEELFPLVYDELRRLARRYLAGQRGAVTLEATALVHEAYMRLVDRSQIGFNGRIHFLATAARAMRHLLIDQARRRGREKRGGQWQRVTLQEAVVPSAGRDLAPDELLVLNTALDKLARYDERQARFIELRFFAGLTVAEAARVLGVSKRTAEGDWTHARAWLKRELSHDAPLSAH